MFEVGFKKNFISNNNHKSYVEGMSIDGKKTDFR